MPALVRRPLIWAATDGLIVQAHGPSEHHKAIQIDYKNRQIKELEKTEVVSKKGTQLESHGIIGMSGLHGVHTRLGSLALQDFSR